MVTLSSASILPIPSLRCPKLFPLENEQKVEERGFLVGSLTSTRTRVFRAGVLCVAIHRGASVGLVNGASLCKCSCEERSDIPHCKAVQRTLCGQDKAPCSWVQPLTSGRLAFCKCLPSCSPCAAIKRRRKWILVTIQYSKIHGLRQ